MGYRWLVARQALLGIGLVLLAAGCGGDAAAGCGLGGSSPAAPAASLAFRCDLDPQGHPASADIFQLRTDGSQAVRLTAGLGWATDPAWSPDGKELALTTTRDGSPNLYLMDSTGGRLRRLTSAPAADSNAAWSPDGRALVFASGRDGVTGPLGAARRHASLFAINADGSDLRQLSRVSGYSAEPAWSPDGSQIAFISDRDGNPSLYVMRSDGGEVRRLTDEGFFEGRPSWSPDGRRLAFFRTGTLGDRPHATIQVIDLHGGKASTLVPGNGYDPAWSPDGSRIAFVSQRDGAPNLYVARSNGGGVLRLTHDAAPKFRPAWRPQAA